MTKLKDHEPVCADKEDRVKILLKRYYFNHSANVDRLMVAVFIFHFILGLMFALTISPFAWSGSEYSVHIHVYAAIFLGGSASFLPAYLCYRFPGYYLNKYASSIGLMFYSILLIHLSGGRIETHFHVFGALAIIAFYRDWRPIALATLITAADHLGRGLFWPESVFGVLQASPWRTVEHAAWVIFEDVFLLLFIKVGWKEMKLIADHTSSTEELAKIRTQQLEESENIVSQQQVALAQSQKLSTIGEMAGGIAHEINTPLNVITLRADQIKDKIDDLKSKGIDINEEINSITNTTFRIAKIVKSLKNFTRQSGHQDPLCAIPVFEIVDSSLSLCQERLRNHQVKLINEIQKQSENNKDYVLCREIEVTQVMLNLLSNSDQATEGQSDRWIRLSCEENGDWIDIRVTDSGNGIPEELKKKILEPFFTTKPVGKGTGLGLSISKKICQSQGGDLLIDEQNQNTSFIVRLRKASNPLNQSNIDFNEYDQIG